MANFGSLGIGGALANALNTGIDFGNKFSNYQQNRYLESSDQISKLAGNEASIFAKRADTIYNANQAARLDRMMQQPARNEVQASQTLQGQRVQGNAEQNAVNAAIIQNVRNSNVYGGVTQGLPQIPQTDIPTYPVLGSPQLGDILASASGMYDQYKTVSPEQMGTRLLEQLRLNGGNPSTSLEGVLNGY